MQLSISSSNCAVLVAPTKILHANGIIGFIKFSTSVNAFCVLWWVHSILVISSYTIVWPYMVNDCTISIAKLKMFLSESKIFLWIKPKKIKTVESLDQCWCLEVRKKARNVFCDEPRSVWPQGVYTTLHLHQVFFYLAWIFSLFSLIFRTSNFWSLRNLIKQLFHSGLLDMRLVIANSAMRLVGYLPSHIQHALMELLIISLPWWKLSVQMSEAHLTYQIIRTKNWQHTNIWL